MTAPIHIYTENSRLIQSICSKLANTNYVEIKANDPERARRRLTDRARRRGVYLRTTVFENSIFVRKG